MIDVHPRIRHQPAPDHPGWWTWDVKAESDGEGNDDSRYNATLGRLLVRPDGEGRGRCRMFPEERHLNLGDAVHGGAILTFIDMALFAGGVLAGADVRRAVTLDLETRFLAPARAGRPLDAVVERLHETKRLAFFRGLVEQDGARVAAFSGALRKATWLA